MRIIRFRVVPDIEEDVFRDIEIGDDRTLEDLYKTIIKVFEFRGDQLASFYLSNENWDKGHEISLMDMGGPELEDTPTQMSKAVLRDIILEHDQKLILVYDFLKMWCFFVEVVDVQEGEGGDPTLVMQLGDAPKEDEKEIPDLMEGIDLEEEKPDDDEDELSKIMNEDDYDDDEFKGFENIDDLDI